MDIRTALVDLSGNARAFLDGYTKLTITPRINGFAEVGMDLPRGLGLGGELSVASRAVRVYDGADLLFHGKVWQPLTLSSKGHSITARDPLAEFVERRAQAKVEFTATNNGGGPWDAAEIVYDRLATQNARRNTFLREGAADESVDRLRTILPGTVEKDLLEEMANAADGFFYRAVPVAGVAGVMADLDIIYPDAGATLPEVLFAFGDGTVDTLDDYEVTSYLPKNRAVAASSASTGGRIAEAAEDADSITGYGLFETELTFNDVTDTTLLEEHAAAQVQASPPRTISATPSAGSPLLFDDFNVGDFVRVQIKDDGLDILEWARVLEATLEINSEGNARLTGISFEFLTGDTITVPPHKLFRSQLDDTRRRVEALERRQQNVTQTAASSPSEPPAGSGSGGGGTPATPPSAPPPPPSTPGEAPTISGVLALAAGPNDIAVAVQVDTKGQATTVTVGASLGGTLVAIAGPAAPSGGSITLNLGDLTPGTTYSISVSASNASGTAHGSGGNVSTPLTGAS